MHFQLHVNGQLRDLDVPPGTKLLEALRDDLGLMGARFGCGRGQCGACFVLVEGRAVASCETSVADAASKAIVTVEGLADEERLHPVQEAFLAERAMQCGYCTSGMIVSAVALLGKIPRPSDDEIREALAPNLCRCGVYGRAIRAVRRASR